MIFVNRDSELSLFRDFSNSPTTPWLMCIYGLNGLGKTTLLQHCTDQLGKDDYWTFIDFSHKNLCEDYLEVIETIANGLMPALPKSACETFAARVNEIRAVRPIIARNTIIARQNSTINTPKQNINLIINEEQAREQLNSGREMARALGDLITHTNGKIFIFLDHWNELVERNTPNFPAWIVEDLLKRLHGKNSGLKVILASDHSPTNDEFVRNALKAAEWKSHSLEPLNRQHSLDFMKSGGLDAQELQEAIFERVGGNPFLIKLALELWKGQPGLDWNELEQELDEQAYLEWLLRRIRQSILDERSRAALSRGVVLNYWKLDMLRTVCERTDQDEDWYKDFISHSFVQDAWNRRGYKQFVRAVREIQLKQIWFQDNNQFHHLHQRALDWFNRDREAPDQL